VTFESGDYVRLVEVVDVLGLDLRDVFVPEVMDASPQVVV
jgi:hypothetical protein